MLNILIDPSRERKIADLRTLGMRDVMTLGRYRYAHAHRPLEQHTHGDMFEICLLDEGVQPYMVAGRKFVLRGGDVLVTFPNEVHGTGRSPENRGRLYWLLVRMPGRRERFLNLPPPQGQRLVRALLSLSPRHFRAPRHLKAHLERIFEAFEREADPFRLADIQNWALRFILDTLRAAPARAVHPLSAAIRRALAYEEEHLSDGGLWIPELAAAAGLSVSHFKAQFKREVGLTPGNHLVQRRIERAQALLRASAASITNVAMQTGFASSQYFATAFKRYTGLTPGQYRAGGG